MTRIFTRPSHAQASSAGSGPGLAAHRPFFPSPSPSQLEGLYWIKSRAGIRRVESGPLRSDSRPPSLRRPGGGGRGSLTSRRLARERVAVTVLGGMRAPRMTHPRPTPPRPPSASAPSPLCPLSASGLRLCALSPPRSTLPFVKWGGGLVFVLALSICYGVCPHLWQI